MLQLLLIRLHLNQFTSQILTNFAEFHRFLQKTRAFLIQYFLPLIYLLLNRIIISLLIHLFKLTLRLDQILFELF